MEKNNENKEPKLITPEACAIFRKACQNNQKSSRLLIQSAMNHVGELAEVRNEITERHTETLMELQLERIASIEKSSRKAHGRIDNFILIILLGALATVVGIIVPYNLVKTDIKGLQAETLALAKPGMHEEARQEFARIKWEIASCREHVAKSDLLIKKYDKADTETEKRDLSMDKRLDAIESTINKYKHSHK